MLLDSTEQISHCYVFLLHVLLYTLPDLLMLCLHYVPGSQGSHSSQKRSSLWGFGQICLPIQVWLSLTTFSQGIHDRSSTAHYVLSWMIVCFLLACHVLLGPLMFCSILTKL